MSNPAWFTALVDQRIALLEQALGHLPPGKWSLVLTPLREMGPNASALELARWERCCDCCTAYCPPTADFYVGTTTRQLKSGQPVTLTYGVCALHRFTPDN